MTRQPQLKRDCVAHVRVDLLPSRCLLQTVGGQHPRITLLRMTRSQPASPIRPLLFHERSLSAASSHVQERGCADPRPTWRHSARHSTQNGTSTIVGLEKRRTPEYCMRQPYVRLGNTHPRRWFRIGRATCADKVQPNSQGNGRG